MKKITLTLLVFCLFIGSVVPSLAEIPYEKLYALSDDERSSLDAEVYIELMMRKIGSKTSHHCRVLDVDYSTITTEELEWIQEYLQEKRNENADNEKSLVGAELCSFLSFSIVVDKAEIKTSSWSGEKELILNITLDNGEKFPMEGCVHFASVNDWEVHPVCSFNVKSGLKKKEEIKLEITDIGVEKLSDIENLSIEFLLYYRGKYIISNNVTLDLR